MADEKQDLLSEEYKKRLTAIFNKIDVDSNGTLTKQECENYWKDTKNAVEMLDQLDTDEDKKVTLTEWFDFFTKLRVKMTEDVQFEQVVAYVEQANVNDDSD